MSDDLVGMARLAQHDERMATGVLYGDLADRIEELEANLAKALKALDAIRLYSTDGDAHRQARATIAELTGGKDE